MRISKACGAADQVVSSCQGTHQLKDTLAHHTILVLGGYGFFGARICTALAANKNIHLLVAGRDPGKARALTAQLGLPPQQALALDAHAPDLAQRLAELQVD